MGRVCRVYIPSNTLPLRNLRDHAAQKEAREEFRHCDEATAKAAGDTYAPRRDARPEKPAMLTEDKAPASVGI
eukprot:g1647.t1